MTPTPWSEPLPAELLAGAERVAIALKTDDTWHAWYWQRGHVQEPADGQRWRFRFASLTKLMTAAAFLRSAGAAGLELDAPVNACLRGTRIQARHVDPPVTARMLLTHTSGLSYFKNRVDRYRLYSGEACERFPGPSLSEYYGRQVRSRLRSGVWHYSSHNFGILGLMLEVLEGESFPSLLQRMILRPLSISASLVPRSAADLTDIASPGGRALNEIVTPANGVVGTLPDLCTFTDALLGGHAGVLSPTLLQSMFTCSYAIGRGFPGMGLGPVLLPAGNEIVAWHNAAYDDYRGSMILCPETGDAAVALSYGAGLRPDAVTSTLIAETRPDVRGCLAYLNGAACEGSSQAGAPIRRGRPGVYLPTAGRFSEAVIIRASRGQLGIEAVHGRGALPFTAIMADGDCGQSGTFAVSGRRIRVLFGEGRSPTLAIAPFNIARRLPVSPHLARILASFEVAWTDAMGFIHCILDEWKRKCLKTCLAKFNWLSSARSATSYCLAFLLLRRWCNCAGKLSAAYVP